MPFVSNAGTSELDSPFFIQNSEICQRFDDFIVSFGGETRGKYNAFSYSGVGKIPHPNKWEFRIAKASFTSGDLILSSKYQSLQHATLWIARNLDKNIQEFIIRRMKWYDVLFLRFQKKSQQFGVSKYVLTSSIAQSDLLDNLKTILHNLFEKDEIWEITFKESTLKIESRSEFLNTEIMEKLIKSDLTKPID